MGFRRTLWLKVTPGLSVPLGPLRAARPPLRRARQLRVFPKWRTPPLSTTDNFSTERKKIRVEFRPSARPHNWAVASDATVKLMTGAVVRMASDKGVGLFRARRG